MQFVVSENFVYDQCIPSWWIYIDVNSIVFTNFVACWSNLFTLKFVYFFVFACPIVLITMLFSTQIEIDNG